MTSWWLLKIIFRKKHYLLLHWIQWVKDHLLEEMNRKTQFSQINWATITTFLVKSYKAPIRANAARTGQAADR